MKNKIKYLYLTVTGISLLLFQACSLDYDNKEAINPENVWKNKEMIEAFLGDLYSWPSWPGGSADESMSGPAGEAQMDGFFRGVDMDVDKQGRGLDYKKIDQVNFFLQQIEEVDEKVVSATEKKEMIGQALFWRAWEYWGKVSQVGGVPLILKVQNIDNPESLFVSRDKTSVCMTQILKDLDDAIKMVPDVWDNVNYGRIDKGIAMAFKGRVLLWYASPLFNPANDRSRWEDAYDANKTAKEFLENRGNGLYDDYTQLWFDEQNKEVVMVHQHWYPDNPTNPSTFRPLYIASGSAWSSQPVMQLMLAFPKKDGSKFEVDLNKLETDPAYNKSFFTDFLKDRDDRFHTTVFIPGTKYPCTDAIVPVDQMYWEVCFRAEAPEAPGGYKYNSLSGLQYLGSLGAGPGGTCYYKKKGIDPNVSRQTIGEAQVDWVEIRFAEVLMNYGECANELDKTDEALQVLYDIRKRAGIESGGGKYGITASTYTDIKQAYMDERYVEFAFENKRFGDLRRWKRYDILNDIKYLSTLRPVLNYDKVVVEIDDFDWTKSIMDDSFREEWFHLEYLENTYADDLHKFNVSLNHWFFPLNRDAINRNKNLEQNNEWENGKFDPLQ